MLKSLDGNRAYRRAVAAKARGAEARKRRQQADFEYNQRSEARADKVANNIAKIKTKKVARMIKLEKSGVGMTKKQNAKLSDAERRQIARKVKTEKFKAKLKKLVQ